MRGRLVHKAGIFEAEKLANPMLPRSTRTSRETGIEINLCRAVWIPLADDDQNVYGGVS
jgi:hypothetical protein